MTVSITEENTTFMSNELNLNRRERPLCVVKFWTGNFSERHRQTSTEINFRITGPGQDIELGVTEYEAGFIDGYIRSTRL